MTSQGYGHKLLRSSVNSLASFSKGVVGMKKKLQEILGSLREFIVEHKYEETPMLTAYVDVDSTDQDNRRDRPAWLIELKNEAKRLEEEHGTEALARRDTQRKWADTEATIMSQLQDIKPQGRSVVIFTDHVDFLTIAPPGWPQVANPGVWTAGSRYRTPRCS